MYTNLMQMAVYLIVPWTRVQLRKRAFSVQVSD